MTSNEICNVSFHNNNTLSFCSKSAMQFNTFEFFVEHNKFPAGIYDIIFRIKSMKLAFEVFRWHIFLRQTEEIICYVILFSSSPLNQFPISYTIFLWHFFRERIVKKCQLKWNRTHNKVIKLHTQHFYSTFFFTQDALPSQRMWSGKVYECRFAPVQSTMMMYDTFCQWMTNI